MSLRAHQIFSKHQRETHDSPFKCNAAGCALEGHSFPQKKDLVRHQKTKDCPTELGTVEVYSCPVSGCKKAAGDAFRRKDNFVRHMRDKHPGIPYHI